MVRTFNSIILLLKYSSFQAFDRAKLGRDCDPKDDVLICTAISDMLETLLSSLNRRNQAFSYQRT